MNHVLVPKSCIAAIEGAASDMSLGGCFYDYLRSSDAKVAGVRYWLIEPVKFDDHPVYSQFFEDERFVFSQVGDYVDIVFDEKSSALLQNGQLTLDVVQEFGGESVVKCGKQFGIVFSILDET